MVIKRTKNMINKATKIIISGSVIIVTVLGVGLYTNTIKLPIEREIRPQYVANFNDDRVLMGASHNVFVGKVIREVGARDAEVGPETQFEVEVVLNVKGDLQGTVVVNQLGGYRNGILYTVVNEGDVVVAGTDDKNSLLQPGFTYLFATRYNDDKNWYTLNSHPNAMKLISQDKGVAIEQLRELAVDDEKIRKLQNAYKSEVLLDDDIRANNTRNSYRSLNENR